MRMKYPLPPFAPPQQVGSAEKEKNVLGCGSKRVNEATSESDAVKTALFNDVGKALAKAEKRPTSSLQSGFKGKRRRLGGTKSS